MALSKVTYVDGVTIIGAKNLNDIQDEIILQGQKQAEDEASLALKANTEDVNAALALKADKSDTYTKEQVDSALSLKANASDVNSALALKADKSDTYTKDEVDSFVSDVLDYVTQMLDANEKTSGKLYYPNNTTIGNASGYCIFPPIELKANKTYTLVNIRPVFTNFKVGSTATSVDSSDAGNTNKTVVFTPESDGQLYVTGGDSANVMVFDAYYPADGTEYIYGKFDYTIKTKTLGNKVTADNCTFFKKCEQLLKSAESQSGYYGVSGGKVARYNSTGATVYAPIRLLKGITYKFIDIYGYFSYVAEEDGTPIERVTDAVSNTYTGTYTPEADCYLYTTVHNAYFEKTAVVINDAKYVPSQYVEGVYYTYLPVNTPEKVLNIHVKQDGTGDYTSVVDAVNFANAQKGNYPINIYVHSGDYDILEELGGDDFLATVGDILDERQGLVLKANDINLIGVGLVILRYELPDTVTYTQSARTSCLNLREFSNRVENLVLIAKNCRYAIHDETNGGNPYIHRVMKNLRCIHKGNLNTLWPYPTVLGGGAGGGSTYDIINCQFITSAYFQAFSYHSNTNEEASQFNIDGCVGSVKDDAPTKISFRLSYHGTGRTGISVGNIKNCSGNGQTVVEPESSGDTDNNIELYVNGWENIAPITVSGNE